MERTSRDPFKIMIAVLAIAIVGLAGIVGIILSEHPVFNPFLYRPRTGEDVTYVSPYNFTLRDGERVVDRFQYSGAGRQSIVLFSVQVIEVDQKGLLYIRFNGIDLGSTYVEAPGVVEARIASCCYVSVVQMGVDNVVEFRSGGFEGSFRYVIAMPTWGAAQ